MENTDFLRERQKTRLPNDDSVHIKLQADEEARPARRTFRGGRHARQDLISEETFAHIVKELEQFNLSATKGQSKGVGFFAKWIVPNFL